MEPVGGAIEAGISSAAVATESAVTVAAKTAEAGAAVAEGAVQTAGAVTETAGGAIPAAPEAAPEAINEGVELAAQEGLAVSIEATLEASGPDVALNQLADVPTGVNTAPPVSSQEVTPAEQNASVNPAEQATVPVDSGISEDIKNDPLFQQKLEEERTAAQGRGEEIDEEKLSTEALAKYNLDKNNQAEQSQLTPEQQKMQLLEAKIINLTSENTELRNNIVQINEALIQMKDILEKLTKEIIDKEQDPKKKVSLLALLIKIMGIIVLSSVMEAGKDVNPLQKQ